MSPRKAAVLGAIALVVLVAGCGREGISNKPKSSASPSVSSTPYAAPNGAPILFDQTQAVVLPEKNVFAVASVGDVVLAMSATKVVARTVPNLGTRYTVDVPGGYAFTSMRAIDDALWLAAVKTTPSTGSLIGSDDVALIKVDQSTGAASAPLTFSFRKDPQAPVEAAAVRLAGLSGGRLVVDLSYPTVPTYQRHHVIALDMGTGKVVWTRRGGTALAVTPARVLVSNGVIGKPGDVESVNPQGKKQWRALGFTSEAHLVGSTRETVSIAHSGFLGAIEIVRLGLRKGTVQKQVAIPSADVTCHQVGPRLSVCAGKGPTLTAWNLDRTKQVWALPSKTRYAPAVTTIVGTSVYGYVASGQPVVISALTGKDIASVPGAAPLSVNAYGGLNLWEGKVTFVPAAQWPPAESASALPSPSPPSGESTPSATPTSGT